MASGKATQIASLYTQHHTENQNKNSEKIQSNNLLITQLRSTFFPYIPHSSYTIIIIIYRDATTSSLVAS